VIAGVAVAVDREAVVVTAERPLHVVSSAPLGGGLATARSIVNLHVAKDFAHESLDALVSALVRRRGLAAPVTALATAAWTERAEVAADVAGGVTAIVVATVGLSNVVAAGLASLAPAGPPPPPSTINTIVVVDARPEPAALVNAIVTITEVKTSVLAAAGVRCASGEVATGTSTDAVLVAATGRGRACAFGGPLSELGWVVARAARTPLEAGGRGWLTANPR
jgi:adenosylcobinamide amidohydrolase